MEESSATGRDRTLVITGSSRLLKELTSAAFRRLDLTPIIVTSGEEAIALVRRQRPLAAVFEASLPDLSGLEACSRIKQDAELRSLPVLIAVEHGVTMARARQLLESGCDGVVILSDDSAAVVREIARLLNMPHREERRIDTCVPVAFALFSGDEIQGYALDISASGARVQVTRAIPPDLSHVEIAFGAPGDPRRLTTAGRIVWRSAPAPAEATARTPAPAANQAAVEQVGVELCDLDASSRLLLLSLARWELEQEDGETLVRPIAPLDEDVEIEDIAGRIAPPVRFDLSRVEQFNSWGVRRWIRLVRKLLPQGEVKLVRLSAVFAMQAGFAPDLIAGARVLSFFAPYACTHCRRKADLLLEVDRVFAGGQFAPPVAICEGCGGPSTLDELPERFKALAPR